MSVGSFLTNVADKIQSLPIVQKIESKFNLGAQTFPVSSNDSDSTESLPQLQNVSTMQKNVFPVTDSQKGLSKSNIFSAIENFTLSGASQQNNNSASKGGGLAGWLGSNVVDPINESLGNIHIPKPTVQTEVGIPPKTMLGIGLLVVGLIVFIKKFR